MRNIKIKVYFTRWSDSFVHCDICGARMYNTGYQSWYCPNCEDCIDE